MIERFFKIKERGSGVRTELIAGMTTFFAMVYILMVNANMFADPLGDGSNPLGVSYGAIYIAAAISAVVGTILFDSLPDAVRVAIPGGIGLFIALPGLQNAGIVVPSTSTCVDLASFNLLTRDWGSIMPLVVTLATFLAIVIMSHKKVRGAVLIGILGGVGLYYLLGLTVDGFYDSLQISVISPFQAFGEFTSQSLFAVLKSGFDFSA
ncbi:MAG: hypothetical protein IJN34_07200 [Clostridia bacterium]|nr:hypothetical protein [Clostridia bacterium]